MRVGGGRGSGLRMSPTDGRTTTRVDLDSLLAGSSLTAECVAGCLRRRPGAALLLPFWAMRGGAFLRRRLAESAGLNVAELPFREEAVEEARRGGPVTIVTTGDVELARRTAEHLGFDRVEASREKAPRAAWRWGAIRRTLRPYQWLKNALVFVPFLLSHQVDSAARWVSASLLFLAFSFCASAGYVVNDIIDRPRDRLHPRRRLRPIASGETPLEVAIWLPAPLLAAAGVCCAFLPAGCAISLGVYVLMTVVYSAKAKDFVMADVLLLAGLYLLRLLAGSIATGNAVSHWLLAFALALFLSLALCKRVSELIAWRALDRDGAPGRRYRAEDVPVLEMMAVASGFVACLTMVLYIQSPEILRLYRRPEYLWVGVVALLYWLGRLFIYSHRGECPDDPLLFAVQDRTTLVVLGVASVCALSAV